VEQHANNVNQDLNLSKVIVQLMIHHLHKLYVPKVAKDVYQSMVLYNVLQLSKDIH